MKRCSVIFAVILLLCGCSRNLKNSISPVSYTSADNFIEKRIERKIEKRIFDFVAEGSEPIQEDIIVPGKFDLSGISHELRATIKGIVNKKQTFPEKYTDMEGILTFRGNNLRDSAAYGKVYIKEKKLEVLWAFETSSRSWGGGAGWTGQAAIIKWPAEAIELMNIKKEFKSRKDLTEAVCPSLDGRIYFLELESGLQTRQHIDIKNPIKGSITLDPRGFPLLYVGQGLQETDVMGFRIFSLIDGKLLHFINGKDSFALRKWCAFDGSPLINRNTDTMILGGENGLLYNIKLNTEFDKVNKTIKLEPEEVKYRYKIKGNSFQGIENSVAAYKNLVYFADNGGSIQAVDLINMETVWVLDKIDDTDATITVEVEEGVPYLYTGTEVDKQGIMGNSHIRKINGLTGEVLWDKQYHCISLQGEKSVNAGMFATNIVGKHDINDRVIFTLARHGEFHKGLMLALDKETGEEIWKWEMPHYTWSSPASVYDDSGKAYVIQCDSEGMVFLLDGKTGEVLDRLNLKFNIESSPAVYNDTIVVATRGGKIYGIKIK